MSYEPVTRQESKPPLRVWPWCRSPDRGAQCSSELGEEDSSPTALLAPGPLLFPSVTGKGEAIPGALLTMPLPAAFQRKGPICEEGKGIVAIGEERSKSLSLMAALKNLVQLLVSVQRSLLNVLEEEMLLVADLPWT